MIFINIINPMSDEIKILIKTLKINKIFNQNIETVFNTLVDTKKTYEAIKDYRSPAIFTKGKESIEIGAEFHFILKKFLTLYITTEEIINNKNYKKIKTKIYKSEPINVVYENIIHLHKITADNSTLIVWEWIYEAEGFPMTLYEVDLLKNERTRMLDKYEKYIHANTDIVQTESVAISCSAKMLLKAISNPYILIKINPSVADRYECEGDSLEIGGVIRLIKGDAITELKVSRYEYFEGIYYYDLICINRLPKQKLRYTVNEINEKQCFMSFSHVFFEFVDNTLLQNVSEQKISVLKTMKEFFKYLSK
jgi:hypothetical protein